MSYTPDYRGTFLRGLGSVTSNHYNIVIHQSGALGQLQGDSIRNITGQVAGGSIEEDSAATYGAIYISGVYPGANHGWNDYGWAFDASRIVPVANENRPVNKAVIYLIKAK
ncbi:MAG: hypothetical protein H6Q70_101 [Firmicutes bacterium]|nr:hypothetical protein [Bacillota bacterium]